MKKIFLFIAIFLLVSCTSNKLAGTSKTETNIKLPSISNEVKDGVLVGVSDPHIYSHKGPKLYSGSYYFNPRNFYIIPNNLNIFRKAYKYSFEDKPVYYYDENNGAQAGLVVYVLRNIYRKENVSLLLNGKIKKELKFGAKAYKIDNIFTGNDYFITGGYIGSGKYLIAYNPKVIKFASGDLLLYASDLGTMKEDSFYKNSTGVDIKNIDWSTFIDFDGNLKSNQEVENLLKPLKLEKYNRIFIYYPKYWYRSGVLALILQK